VAKMPLHLYVKPEPDILYKDVKTLDEKTISLRIGLTQNPKYPSSVAHRTA
jgi:hypothetical protein